MALKLRPKPQPRSKSKEAEPHLKKAIEIETEPHLKKVINGKAFNTETAVKIHQVYDDEPKDEVYWGSETLYKTRYGANFLAIRNRFEYDPRTDELEPTNTIKPISRDEAISWLEKHANEKILQYYDVEEAGDPDATLTLRMHKSLKKLLQAKATDADLSLNAWCVAALQQALEASETVDQKVD